MPNIFELSKFFQEFGIIAFIIVSFGMLGIYLSVKFFLNLHDDIKDVTTITKQLGDKIVTDKGNPVIHYDILREIESELQELRQDAEIHANNASRHYEEVIRLNSGEVYAHCNIDKCPHLLSVIGNIKEVGQLFEQFNIKADESRRATGSSLEDVRFQMNTLASEVSAQSKQVVQLLGDVLVGRKK